MTIAVTCRDESGEEIRIRAATPKAAARKYASAYEATDRTIYVRVYWRRALRGTAADYDGSILVSVEPTSPPCSARRHDWREVSVTGHGGGVIQTCRCTHCGRVQITDTWAQDPTTGQQGLTSVRYEEPSWRIRGR